MYKNSKTKPRLLCSLQCIFTAAGSLERSFSINAAETLHRQEKPG